LVAVLLRFLAISLLIYIALRLLGRLLATLLGRREKRQPGPAARPSSERPPEQRQLEPCPHCGTYFDPESALTVRGSADHRFCSSSCLEAHALEGSTTDGPSM